MYSLVLFLHSWIRWGVIIAGVLAVATLFSPKPQSGESSADRWGFFFITALDLQFLLGILLYLFISPNTTAMFSDFGAAMRDPVARFWAVEHLVTMLLAVVVAHVGRVLARKATSPASRRRRQLICFTIALIAILGATPWPGMRAGRPLFRVSSQT